MPTAEYNLDLWADDIRVEILTPLMILCAQEPALRKKTKGVLRTVVESHEGDNREIHEFLLVAPVLDNYRESILTVEHSKNRVYPCKVTSDGLRFYDEQSPSYEQVASSQDQFVEILKFALQSNVVRSVIDSLLAKSNEIQADNARQTKTNQKSEA